MESTCVALVHPTTWTEWAKSNDGAEPKLLFLANQTKPGQTKSNQWGTQWVRQSKLLRLPLLLSYHTLPIRVESCRRASYTSGTRTLLENREGVALFLVEANR